MEHTRIQVEILKGYPDDKDSTVPWPETSRCKQCKNEILVFPWNEGKKVRCNNCIRKNKIQEKRNTLSVTIAGIITAFGIINFPTHFYVIELSRDIDLWYQMIAVSPFSPFIIILIYVLLGIDLIIIMAGFLLIKHAHKEWNILRND